MSNKISNHLFELIANLNKSEKRYFTLYASRHTIGNENNYIKLFNYLSNLESYDESLLIKHFKGNPFLNQFSTTKSRLYQMILKSLDLFHASKSINAQINSLIHSADILFDKGLYQQAKKVYLQAEKLALKNEKPILALMVKDHQKKLNEKDLYAHQTEHDVKSFHLAISDRLTEIQLYNQLWEIKSLLFVKINEIGVIRSEREKLMLDKIIFPLTQINIEKYNHKIKYLGHQIFSTYYFTIKDYTQSFVHLKAILKLFKSNTSLLKTYFNAYFSALTNLVYIATKLGNYASAEIYLNTLKQIPNAKHFKKSPDIEIKFYSSIYSLELFLLNEQNNFENTTCLVTKIEHFYHQYKNQINPIREAYLDFKIATTYLTQNNFSQALKWTNKILNNSELDKRLDLFSFSKIINLIIHFEMNNTDFLPYALTSTKRYLKTKKRLYQFEKIFLKAISRLTKKDMSKFDVEEVLIPFEKELKALKCHPFEKQAFEYFDFALWVSSKINGKSIIQLKSAS